MTQTGIQFEELNDARQFNAALNTLLQFAHENDVDIEGSWDCRSGPSYPDWDTTITEVQKQPPSDRCE